MALCCQRFSGHDDLAASVLAITIPLDPDIGEAQELRPDIATGQGRAAEWLLDGEGDRSRTGSKIDWKPFFARLNRG